MGNGDGGTAKDQVADSGTGAEDGRSQPRGTESFRDSMTIVSKEGKRSWIYPKQPSGRYYRWRTILSLLLLAFLFGMPFIRMHDQPYFLFNVVETEVYPVRHRLRPPRLLPSRRRAHHHHRLHHPLHGRVRAALLRMGLSRRPSSWRWCSGRSTTGWRATTGSSAA